MTSSPDNDPAHPVLPDSYLWELVEFTHRRDADGGLASSIDLVFARDGVTRRLRFRSPQMVQVDRGPPGTDGLFVLDVSARQLDGLRVRVVGAEEGSWPAFWAADVAEVGE